MRQLEKQTHLKRTILDALFSLCLSLAVLSERIQATGFVDIDLLVSISALDQLVVHLHSLGIIAVMEAAVSNTKKGAGLGVVGILAIALQKTESSHEVTLFQEMICVWKS